MKAWKCTVKAPQLQLFYSECEEVVLDSFGLTKLHIMEMGKVLRFFIVFIMVAGFLAQMWKLFGQFLSGMKTVAVSFEERKSMEFPTFAFCDSRAVKRRMATTVNEAQFNATTFNVEEEITLQTIGNIGKPICF